MSPWVAVMSICWSTLASLYSRWCPNTNICADLIGNCISGTLPLRIMSQIDLHSHNMWYIPLDKVVLYCCGRMISGFIPEVRSYTLLLHNIACNILWLTKVISSLQAVKRTLKLSCKCHGVSGSCSIRTCWKELPDFRVVGDYIKKKYFRSVMVDAQNGQLRKGNSAQRRDERDILQISKNDLVYLESSPDFCKNNTVYGTMGTLGRSCSRPEDRNGDNRWERKSCNRLCKACGLKVKRILVTETSTCNCRFHWCCEVKCESCTKVVEKFTCVST